MNNVIIESLNYFYEKHPADVTENALFENEIIDLYPTVLINSVRKKYNLLGVVNNNTHQFTWAWHLNIAGRQYLKSKQLLFYAINKEPVTLNDAYVRRLLTSSVIDNIDKNTLILIMALSIYLTKADSIFSAKDETESVILYYGLYNMD